MRQQGFTLPELMITLAVTAILLTVAVPSFQELFVRNRLVTFTNELVTAINLARSEAVKRGRPVRLTPCRAADCVREGNDWGNGWIVWRDADGDAKVDAGESVREFIPSKRGSDFTLTLASGDVVIEFDASGRAGAAQCFDLAVDGRPGKIDVALTGAVKATKEEKCP